MPYFSLIQRRPYDSDSEDDSDDSYPDLTTAPKRPRSPSPIDSSSLSDNHSPKRARNESATTTSCKPIQPTILTTVDHLTSGSSKPYAAGFKKVNDEARPDHLTSGSSKPYAAGFKKVNDEAGPLSAVEEENIAPCQPIKPDWHALLFGGRENLCDPIMKYPKLDTYSVDCKLAEDVALNQLAKYDLPVFNSLRDSNQNQVTHALKCMQKGKTLSGTEEILACILMLDFLSCCCQEGNLLNLYEKSKDNRKRYHIDILENKLVSMLDYFKLSYFSLDQMRCLEKFVMASLQRIPSSLHINTYSLKFALRRKLSAMEREEQCRKENSVYNFSDEIVSLPTKKKLKSSSVVATSKKWKEQPAEPQHFTHQKLQSSSVFLSKPASFTSLCTPTKTDVTQVRPVTSTPESVKHTSICKSPGSSHFISNLFKLDDDLSRDVNQNVCVKEPSEVSQKMFSSKENAHPTSSKKIFSPKVRQVSPFKSSSSKFSKEKPVTDGFSSDDSLPDIPIDLETYVQKKRTPAPFVESNLEAAKNPSDLLEGSKQFKIVASDSFDGGEDSNAKTEQAKNQFSPYKSKLTTWNASKYSSPSKAHLNITGSAGSPLSCGKILKSPLKEFVPSNKQNEKSMTNGYKGGDLLTMWSSKNKKCHCIMCT